MKKCYFIFSLMLLMVACTPTATPAPAPLAPNVPKVNLPSTVEDDVWINIVKAAKKEGMVNIYSFSWTGDTGLVMAKAFGDRYGVKLNIITGRGAEFLERVKTEARMGQVVADLWEGSLVHSENMKLTGLLTTAGGLPILQEKEKFTLDPRRNSPEGYYYIANQYYIALHVNTNLVKRGEEPTAWVDLLSPKWKGNLIFTDPNLSDNTSYLAILIEQKRLTLDFLEKLGKQDLKFDSSPSGLANRLARGEAAIGYTGASVTNSLAREGAPLKMIDTIEGVFGTGLALGMVKKAPHPNATRLLINWGLSQEGQDTYSKDRGLLSVRNDVSDYQHPAIQLKPQNPIFLTPEYNDLIARVFREKQYVQWLKPK